MASTHNFRKLAIWKDGIQIAKETYATTKIFPKSEVYGLCSQMQRSAVSIPSNIAEGTARSTNKHFIQYLENALGSAYEWETQLIIAFEVGYVSEKTYTHLETKINKIQAMISKFIDGLSQN
ncbi:four helix bundle protein [Sinomicrobium weinanense]|uniref:Four helix bundle protein n=1 Tax=Sinomicrobium weinanense TaxID=2842200 RepID=A0A926JVV9_9FLAO|nr:four helix bundle protein [Sinomicrobium weinanense]MBC9798147.1 four helix bundle protein [Sinomicrobium weinanense]MBU3122574.1 four helix bundle protein [Sinomicrobium weinanense]